MKALGAMLKDEQRGRPEYAAARAGRRAYMRSHRAQKKLEEMRASTNSRNYVKHQYGATPREPRYLCQFCYGMSWCRESDGCPLGPVGCGLPFAPERIR